MSDAPPRFQPKTDNSCHDRAERLAAACGFAIMVTVFIAGLVWFWAVVSIATEGPQ